jgi:RNA polymerase sigma-70 factor (ECF subfamily)
MSDEGDRKFEKFWPYYKRVVSCFTNLGYSREEARDLTQEVFLRVYQRVDRYRDEGPLSYLLTTARNIAKNDIRDRHTRKRKTILESEEKLAGMSDDRIRDMEEVVQSGELGDRLRRAVERLEPGHRACVRLYLADLSYEEIAQSLGLSVSAVKSRLNLARKELRELMMEELEGFGDES